jgi:hypothetical protein
MHAVGMCTRLSDEIRVESGRSDIRYFSRVSVSKWPRPCENVKVLGFRVSLYPSQVATKPIQRDLKGRFFRRPHSARVFTRPRSRSDANVARWRKGPNSISDCSYG